MTESWQAEVESGERFQFGKNWAVFLQELSEERIRIAEESLRSMLGFDNLSGKTFLDIGSGSGLFSLAAFRLGARVVSFDFDEDSVACTRHLAESVNGQSRWFVRSGSVLDRDFLSRLSAEFGGFDIIYSWGVLHHTGAMWSAINNAAHLAHPGSLVYIAIYNDQGILSKWWRKIKQIYCKLPGPFKWLVLLPAFIVMWSPAIILDLCTGKGLSRWKGYKVRRGMSPWRDVVDWVGGYPFEVAKPEEILKFFKERGFSLENLTTTQGHGCCQYVFHLQDKVSR